MQKLITLNESQQALMEKLMEDTYQSSASAFFVLLMFFYEQNKKRPQGRPKSNQDEEDTLLYKTPDKHGGNTTYTRDELEDYYNAHDTPTEDRHYIPAK